MKRIILLLALIALALQAQNYTLGVGVYPGDPKENFAPAMRIDSSTYRNLALHRPAYHSSSYDYNLTAQLVTDGIKETALPRWISTSTSAQGVLDKVERELFLDGNWVTGVDLPGPSAWVQVQMAGGASPLEVDRIDIDGSVKSPSDEPEIWASHRLRLRTMAPAGSSSATWKAWRVPRAMSAPPSASPRLRATASTAWPSRIRARSPGE